MPPLSGHGQMPLASDNPGSDFHLVPCRDAEDGAAKLLQIIAFAPAFGSTRSGTSRSSVR